MEIFLTLLLKLVPLYVLIAIGLIAAKYLKAQKETVSSLLIYIIAPIVIFYGVVQTEITLALLSLPILFFVLCCLTCGLFYLVGKIFWPKDNTKNILAFTAGTGNTGYFGLPVALMLFGDQALGVVVLSILGFILYENSLGFFITARGHHTVKESVVKVLKLPTIYAFILGLALNLGNVELGEITLTTIGHFKGAYTVLGMMIIGMGLATVKLNSFDPKFIGLTFFAKFLIWPILIWGIISLDANSLHFYDQSIHKIMILMAIVPLAANTVALATELKVQPEKAAVTVLLSTVFALFYIPLVVTLLF
jgi:malate permease and related proteins